LESKRSEENYIKGGNERITLKYLKGGKKEVCVKKSKDPVAPREREYALGIRPQRSNRALRLGSTLVKLHGHVTILPSRLLGGPLR